MLDAHGSFIERWMIAWCTPELMACILDKLPFLSLLSVAQTQKYGGHLVQTLLCLRFKALLRKFFGGDTDRAEAELRDTRSLVYGSGSSWIITYPCGWFPNDLNILSPKSTHQHFYNFVRHSRFETDGLRAGSPGVSTVTAFARDGKAVTIAQRVDEDCLPGILSSHMTSQMIAVNPDGVIIFYPTLTLSSVYTSSVDTDGQRPADISTRLIDCKYLPSGGVTGRCGMSCVKVDRRVHDLEGACCVSWALDKGGRSKLKAMAAACHYTYRLQDKCRRDSCLYEAEGEIVSLPSMRKCNTL